MKPEERRILESINLHLVDLSEDAAQTAAALTDCSAALQDMANAVSALARKLGELYDRQEELISQFGRYVEDTAREKSSYRSDIRKVDERLKLLEGGRGG